MRTTTRHVHLRSILSSHLRRISVASRREISDTRLVLLSIRDPSFMFESALHRDPSSRPIVVTPLGQVDLSTPFGDCTTLYGVECKWCRHSVSSGVEWSGVEWSGEEWSGVEWTTLDMEWSANGVEWTTLRVQCRHHMECIYIWSICALHMASTPYHMVHMQCCPLDMTCA